MAGNSQRRGAVRKAGTKKGPTVGSGGVRRRGLEGKGATPPAKERPHHPAGKRAAKAARSAQGRHKKTDETEIVLGRNAVLECLRAGAPATALYVALGADADEKLTESVQLAADKGISILEVPKHDLDRIAANGMHQGIGLQIPPYKYADVDELIARAAENARPGMFVILDNITDPRNLGAVIRSVAAFGGDGVIIPERRSASVTAVAWRTSAGTAARLPVARATNITRTVQQFQKSGYQVVGLDAGGEHTLDTYNGATDPVVIVIGSEGKGISRLVRENCDVIMSIPMTDWVESLNASVAAGSVLSEFARQRRAAQ